MVWRFFHIFAANMELQKNSVIIDDRLDRMLEPELGGHFTHAYCTAGLCEVTFNGQVFTFAHSTILERKSIVIGKMHAAMYSYLLIKIFPFESFKQNGLLNRQDIPYPNSLLSSNV